VIVRLMGEGQFLVDDALAAQLEAIDEAAATAVEADDGPELSARLDELHALVRGRGEELDPGDLRPSDLIVPPADLSLDEARRLFEEEGLIPDLPG